MSRNSPTPEPTRTVDVVGETVVSVRVESTDPAWARTTRTIGFECSSGAWIEGSWTGIEIRDLLDAARVPDDTTHLLVRSADGYCGCVAVGAVLDGLIAVAGEVDPAASDRDAIDQTGFPRLVAPSLYGPRAVKNVARIEPASLGPGEDPEHYENWQPDESADPSA